MNKSALKIVGPCRGGVEAVRGDGLRVFLDGDKVLDDIRESAPDRRTVILAVALRRAQQIAIGYARKHAPDLAREIEAIVNGSDFGAPPGLPYSSTIARFTLIECLEDQAKAHDFISYPQEGK